VATQRQWQNRQWIGLDEICNENENRTVPVQYLAIEGGLMSRETESLIPWVEGKTIGSVLHGTAGCLASQPAAFFPQHGLTATYGEFDRLVNDAARGFMALGIERGDHVAIWATNWPQWVITQFATARIGAVLVNINPAYRANELEYVLKQSDSKLLLTIDQFKSSNYLKVINELIPELAESPKGRLVSQKFTRLEAVVFLGNTIEPGMMGWSELLRAGQSITDERLAQREASLDPCDPINMQYTSGTTGFPKGAMLSHRNLLLNAYYSGQCQQLTARDRVCIPVPFYHCFGCVLGTLACVVHGAAMVVPADYYEPDKTLDALERYQATSVYGVPTMFIGQLEHPSYPERNLTSLRTGIMAGSPCPIELMKRVTGEMGAKDLTIAYGLTEFSPVITQTRTNDPIEKRVETVGRPLPGVEVKIIDPAAGTTLAAGEPGELCARGHGTMIGYYNMPEATAKAIDRDGWLHTGDIAVETADGYYKITGRIKDMIIRGGENIYPREIEEFLYTHPKVEEVQVVGVPDEKYGEEVAAWIKLKGNEAATPDEVRQFCRERIAHYKVPRYVKFVTSYPMTVTGKIQKFKMREIMIEELSLKKAAEIQTA
jgi:fatty-acyl-CoA synthase